MLTHWHSHSHYISVGLADTGKSVDPGSALVRMLVSQTLPCCFPIDILTPLCFAGFLTVHGLRARYRIEPPTSRVPESQVIVRMIEHVQRDNAHAGIVDSIPREEQSKMYCKR